MPPTQTLNQPNEVIVLHNKTEFEALATLVRNQGLQLVSQEEKLVTQGEQLVSQGVRIIALENENANRNNPTHQTPTTLQTTKGYLSNLMAAWNAWRLGSWLWTLITTGFAIFMIWTLPVQATVVGVIMVVVGATIYYIYPPKEKLT